ncbi:hypothetical protein BS78_09G098100 [Paspalum vaginatum]|nr:hypothetical protein BS78_09G098100 [Paspalum vaginatum]
MDVKARALCFVLLLVGLQFNPSSADGGNCFSTESGCPICVGFLCKATCKLGASMFNSELIDGGCRGNWKKSCCHCYYCDEKAKTG